MGGGSGGNKDGYVDVLPSKEGDKKCPVFKIGGGESKSEKLGDHKTCDELCDKTDNCYGFSQTKAAASATEADKKTCEIYTNVDVSKVEWKAPKAEDGAKNDDVAACRVKPSKFKQEEKKDDKNKDKNKPTGNFVSLTQDKARISALRQHNQQKVEHHHQASISAHEQRAEEEE